MVNLVDLLHLSSLLAFETKQTWFRKPNGGPRCRTSMSMILFWMIFAIVMIIIIMWRPACFPVSSLSQTDWESGSAGSAWLTMRHCTMTKTNYGKRVRTHTQTHIYTWDLKESNRFWFKMLFFIQKFQKCHCICSFSSCSFCFISLTQDGTAFVSNNHVLSFCSNLCVQYVKTITNYSTASLLILVRLWYNCTMLI